MTAPGALLTLDIERPAVGGRMIARHDGATDVFRPHDLLQVRGDRAQLLDGATGVLRDAIAVPFFICAAIYAANGLKGVRDIFPAGQSSESHGLRITSANGQTLFESVPEDMQVFDWPKAVPEQDWETRKTHLQNITSPKTELELTVGAYKLRDGHLLWFGRTDAVAQLYQQNITLYLWLAGILAAAVASAVAAPCSS